MVTATEAATEAAATQSAQATEVGMLLRGVAVQVRVRVRLRLRSRRVRVRVRVRVLVWSRGRTRGCGKCPAAGSSGTTRSKT
jgi:hypothetical protein